MTYNIETPLVITPTTCSDKLIDAVESVSNQTIETKHLIVVDGGEYVDYNVLNEVEKFNNVSVCILPFNTGKGGFYGHRVFAGFSHLINNKYILFLDQDNWYEDSHVESLVSKVRLGYAFAHSLRNIFSEGKAFICRDNCESLGKYPTWVANNSHLVDTSAYCFDREFLIKYGHLWHCGWGADRNFFGKMLFKLSDVVTFACTGKYTLNYRLGGNTESVKPEFFIEGNKAMFDIWNGNFPWDKSNW